MYFAFLLWSHFSKNTPAFHQKKTNKTKTNKENNKKSFKINELKHIDKAVYL